jgi:hypothetical protein
MKKYLFAIEQPNVLSRFKVYEAKHHLHPKVYRNRGVLKDAERFSLVDTVLDGEYNDFVIIEGKKSLKKSNSILKKMHLFMVKSKKMISGILFRGLLFLRLGTYYIFHLRYRI